MPILLGIAGLSWKLAALVGLGTVVMAAGVVIDVLRRVCGLFAFGEDGEAPLAHVPDPGIGPVSAVRDAAAEQKRSHSKAG